MAVFKCKMCGGKLEVSEGMTVCECEYCGTKQTLPRLDSDRKSNLYDRANHFRRNNDFDKAIGIYEQILNEDNSDAEAYWSLVLCRYGIEYVEDPQSHKRIPTVNRAQFTSIYMDEDYKSAIKYADAYQKTIYEAEAKAIDVIQKGILEISSKEEPFDVFICYKETDANGRRTQDSVLANDLYHQLANEGFKVFFSRITLEDKLGVAYEPYIFAALNSAKVMVVLGTRPDYFNAVWVRNEWSRYLALVKNSNGKKTLIPAYRDMDPYDLPEEFSHLQAQDMSKLGFMQDLIRGIKKIISSDDPKTTVKETVVVNTNRTSTTPLLERVFLFLEDGKWEDADIYCEKVLDIDPKNADAYLGKLMAELQVKNRKALADYFEPFDDRDNFNKVIRFGDENLEEEMRGYISLIKTRNENARLTGIYDDAMYEMRNAKSEAEYKSAADMFHSISGFKDAIELKEKCLEKAEISRKNEIYISAKRKIQQNTISSCQSAITIFRTIPDWKDSEKLIEYCQKKIEEIKTKEEADRKENERKEEERRIVAKKASKKRRRIIAIASIVVCAVGIIVAVLIKVIIPNQKYEAAIALKEEGKYVDAVQAFNDLDGYKDSEAQIESCMEAQYKKAIMYKNAGECNEAITAFEEIKDYKDSASQIIECQNEITYNQAVDLMNDCKYEEAIALFNTIDNYKDSPSNMKECLGQNLKSVLSNETIGSTIKFGFYEQDNDVSNGAEPIEWIVLEVDDGKVLVISKYILGKESFNEDYESTETTWSKSTIRVWLNDSFYNEAFGEGHQQLIIRSPEKNEKIYLLSEYEALKYFKDDNTRKCMETPASNYDHKYDNHSWWLRTTSGRKAYGSDESNLVEFVRYDGSIDYGHPSRTDGVRPVMWISLES